MRSTACFDVVVGWDQDIDPQAEILRLRKTLEQLSKNISSKEKLLADEQFRSKAPPVVVQNEEKALGEQKLEHFKLIARLQTLEGVS